LTLNREIEQHDSTLSKVEINHTNATLSFDRAYVHCSEGTPGIDSGTGWSQKINLILRQVATAMIPDDLPNDISDGYIIVNGNKLDNMIPLPFKVSGKIELMFITQYGKELKIDAEQAYTEEIDQPIFIENFPGLN
jgi:hypothetical protein